MNLQTLLSNDKDEAIRYYAEQIGNQAGQLVTNFLSGLLIIMTDKSTQSFPKQSKHLEDKNPDKLLKAPEVAQILNISKAKVYNLMKSETIPTIRIGKTVRVRYQDLETFLNQVGESK